MNCHQVKEYLSPFLDDELDPSRTAAIKAHLIRCPDCRRERDRLEHIGAQLRSIPPVTAPRDFEFQIYSRIRDRTTTRSTPNTFEWTKMFVPLAAMIVGLLLSPMLFNNHQSTQLASNLNPEQNENLNAFAPIVEDMDEIVEYKFDGYNPLKKSLASTTLSNQEASSQTRSTPSYQLTSFPNTNKSNTYYVLDSVPVRTRYEKIIY